MRLAFYLIGMMKHLTEEVRLSWVVFDRGWKTFLWMKRVTFVVDVGDLLDDELEVVVEREAFVHLKDQ